MYKANSDFSFGGKVYVKGQEVDIKEKTAVQKLLDQKFISEGKGKSTEDVEAAKEKELQKEMDENRKLADEEAQAEYDRVFKEKNAKAGPNAAPSEPAKPKMTVKDETKK
jgi:hypothetical protein